MDRRLDPAPVVAAFADAVRPVAGVLAFYAGGSLASGDFQPGRSDLDLAAVVSREPGRRVRAALREVHAAFDDEHPKLHCAYVPAGDAAAVGLRHVTWAHRRLLRRPFSGIGRAEPLTGGIVVYVPPPSTFLPSVNRAALAEAAHVELRGYWTGAVRKPGSGTPTCTPVWGCPPRWWRGSRGGGPARR